MYIVVAGTMTISRDTKFSALDTADEHSELHQLQLTVALIATTEQLLDQTNKYAQTTDATPSIIKIQDLPSTVAN